MPPLRSTLSFIILALAHAACGNAPPLDEVEQGASSTAASAHVVDLTALDYAFAMPLEIPSGWVTFRMENLGAEEHVAVVEKVVDTLDLEIVQDLVREGEWHAIPLRYASGPGMVSPGRTGLTTVYLEPGVYVMHCGVRTPEGEPHSAEGMVLAFRVTDQLADTAKPATTHRITVSSYAMSTDRSIGAGAHTFDVRFDEPEGPPYDVFVARLEAGQSVDDVVEWMEYGYGFRAPSEFDFIGGTEQRPGLFQVTLEPGRYAFVSHQGARAGLAEEIVIPEGGEAPAVSDEVVNPPVVVTLPDGDRVTTSRPGRTRVTFENRSDSRRLYHLHQLKPGFTEAEYYEFVQPAGLHLRLFDGEPESVPFYTATVVGLGPRDRNQANLDLRESTYFLFPIVGAHMGGGRALSSSEMEAIKKVEVR